ncbi:MAG: Maf family protein [Myxococcota bacterium]|nr:Maf family protein [Myxococcota bacterium]
MTPISLILASGSPRRRSLLRTCGIPIAEVVPSNIPEERQQDESPTQYTIRLSREKATAQRHRNAYVLAADTIVCLNELVLEKPQNDIDASRMLETLSGRWHTVVTAWAIAHHPQNLSEAPSILDNGYTASKVKFRQLQTAEIQSYIQTGEGKDKAGSYGIQGLGAALVESIQGDYSNIVGLPMRDVIHALKKIGIQPTMETK